MKPYHIRQPVLDRKHVVYGYEFLFRSNADELSRRTIQGVDARELSDKTSRLADVQRIAQGRKCFINFNRQELLERRYSSLSPASTVVEVSESACQDTKLVEACRQVRKSGYSLALDDYVVKPKVNPMLKQIDLLKIDFQTLTEEQHAGIVHSGKERGIAIVADGLLTPDDFIRARQFGYTYFQGYFFCRPQQMELRPIPASHLHCLRLLQTVNQPDFQVDRIDQLIRQDASLCVRLLTYLNSSTFALREKVSSIRQAVGLMGQRPLRKWVSLMTVSELSREKPLVLMNTSLIRGKLCEAVAERLFEGATGSEGFLVGMFSLLDAILDQPMAGVLKELTLSVSLQDALLQVESPLRNVLDLAKALEEGNWQRITDLASSLLIDEDAVFAEYQHAVVWASEVLSGLS